MTNMNLKQEMGLVYQSLSDLQAMANSEDTNKQQIRSFITLLKDRYEQLESDLCDQLDTFDLQEHYREHGTESGYKYARSLFKVCRSG